MAALGACGDTYAHLLVVRGNPPDKPCGWATEWSCTGIDAIAHEKRADEIFKLVRKAWNTLMAAENERKDWSETQALEPQVAVFEEEHKGMKRWSIWGPVWADSAIMYLPGLIQSTQNVQRLGVCALELLNAALGRVDAGQVQPPYTPEPEPWLPDLPDGGGFGLGMGAIAAVAVLLLLTVGRS